jgi:acetylornithine deacetylase/succinyl-diaminopimelate desuccinylase-like protein
MTKVGIKVQIFKKSHHPIVYGEIIKEGQPTVLIYGHYDCQPPEPLDQWTSPPFEPMIRNGKIYGCGSSDNKGQLFTYLKAVETLIQVEGSVPLSLKFLFEGEEEIGSPSLKPFAINHRQLLKADLALYSDSHIHESGKPLLILGFKGMLYVELIVRIGSRDLHSMQATSIPNPAWQLVWALSTLKDRSNHILIPGFYDAVAEPTPLERKMVAQIPYDEQSLLNHFGIKDFLPGRDNSNYYMNLIFEPTCNIAGIVSGYVDPGAKTVLPALASAKIDFRLVPNQEPMDILDKLNHYLEQQGFKDIKIVPHMFIEPSRTPIEHPAVEIIKCSIRQVYGEDPLVLPNTGASGPNYIFTGLLGQPCFLIPYATCDQNNHAPNENMNLESFFKGIYTGITLIQNLAKSSSFRD